MDGLKYTINLNHVEYPMNIGMSTKPKDLLSSTLQLFMQSYSNKKKNGAFRYYNSADKSSYIIRADHHKLDTHTLNNLILAKKIDKKITNQETFKPNIHEATLLLACINDYIKTFAGIVELTKLEYLSKIRYNLALQYKQLRV